MRCRRRDQVFNQSDLEIIADILALWMSGSNETGVRQLLTRSFLGDPTPAISLPARLFNSFVDSQRRNGSPRNVMRFVALALDGMELPTQQRAWEIFDRTMGWRPEAAI